MGEPGSNELTWYSPDPRAIFPLDAFHVPVNLARVIRSGRFDVRIDTAFVEVVRECAQPRRDEAETWITPQIIASYTELHRRGNAHSVEAWRDDVLVGGLYGVTFGGAFFGESMFSRPTLGGRDASKVCLVALVRRLRDRGYELLDTQFKTDHLAQFGCVEISREAYLQRLRGALDVVRQFN